MKRVTLGKTGISAARFAMGGIVVMEETPETAARWVAEAVNSGIDYFDVAPAYGDAQNRLGPALEPYRNRVTLTCKTEERSAKQALGELDNSLRALRTDHFDVYQLHAMCTEEDIAKALAPGGALEVLRNAREQGKARFLGFSSHDEEIALKLIDLFDFDTVMFPINWAMMMRYGFGARLLTKAAERGMGSIAIKAQAFGAKRPGEDCGKVWYRPITDSALADLALRFTLSQDVHIAVSSGEPSAYRLGLDSFVRSGGDFPPLSDAELAALQAAAEGADRLFE